MPFTPQRFAEKLREVRQSIGDTLEGVANATGIGTQALEALENGSATPSGDEVLILADYFRRDFTWFIEDEASDPDESVDLLLRSEGGQLTSADRHAIAEFLHMCKSQALLDELLEVRRANPEYTYFPPRDARIWRSHKEQGRDCARAFRQLHGLPPHAVIPDIFNWLRDAGIRVFRRALTPNSSISGLFIRHPDAGRCILINYSEDIYRQRFSAAHEAGHALMDGDKQYNVSRPKDESSNNWIEVRANSFASCFLMPPELLASMGTSDQWRRPEKIVTEADRLFVSIPALLSALRRDNVIDEATRTELRGMRLKLPEKREPELAGNLSSREFERKRALLAAGLNYTYVHQGLEAHRRGLISLAKVADMFLVEPGEVNELAVLFGISFGHG